MASVNIKGTERLELLGTGGENHPVRAVTMPTSPAGLGVPSSSASKNDILHQGGHGSTEEPSLKIQNVPPSATGGRMSPSVTGVEMANSHTGMNDLTRDCEHTSPSLKGELKLTGLNVTYPNVVGADPTEDNTAPTPPNGECHSPKEDCTPSPRDGDVELADCLAKTKDVEELEDKVESLHVGETIITPARLTLLYSAKHTPAKLAHFLKGKLLTIPADQCVTLGRSEGSKIRLNDDIMSRFYGEIRLGGERSHSFILKNVSSNKVIEVLYSTGNKRVSQTLQLDEEMVIKTNYMLKFHTLEFKVYICPGDPVAKTYQVEVAEEKTVPKDLEIVNQPIVLNHGHINKLNMPIAINSQVGPMHGEHVGVAFTGPHYTGMQDGVYGSHHGLVGMPGSSGAGPIFAGAQGMYSNPESAFLRPHQPSSILQSVPVTAQNTPYRASVQAYKDPAQAYRDPGHIYRDPGQVYRDPAQAYRDSGHVYRNPAQVYRGPPEAYRGPAQAYRDPALAYRGAQAYGGPPRYSNPVAYPGHVYGSPQPPFQHPAYGGHPSYRVPEYGGPQAYLGPAHGISQDPGHNEPHVFVGNPLPGMGPVQANTVDSSGSSFCPSHLAPADKSADLLKASDFWPNFTNSQADGIVTQEERRVPVENSESANPAARLLQKADF